MSELQTITESEDGPLPERPLYRYNPLSPWLLASWGLSTSAITYFGSILPISQALEVSRELTDNQAKSMFCSLLFLNLVCEVSGCTLLQNITLLKDPHLSSDLENHARRMFLASALMQVTSGMVLSVGAEVAGPTIMCWATLGSIPLWGLCCAIYHATNRNQA